MVSNETLKRREKLKGIVHNMKSKLYLNQYGNKYDKFSKKSDTILHDNKNKYYICIHTKNTLCSYAKQKL